jgi:hypothetical protein
MHHAPAVSFSVGRSRFQCRLMLMLIVLGACTLLAWVGCADAFEWRHLGALILWLMVSAWAGVAWRRSPQGILAWDGQAWTWTCKAELMPVEVDVIFDVQDLLLLRLRMVHTCCWVWPELCMDRSHWIAFRRAVFAPQAIVTHSDALGTTL